MLENIKAKKGISNKVIRYKDFQEFQLNTQLTVDDFQYYLQKGLIIEFSLPIGKRISNSRLVQEILNSDDYHEFLRGAKSLSNRSPVELLDEYTDNVTLFTLYGKLYCGYDIDNLMNKIKYTNEMAKQDMLFYQEYEDLGIMERLQNSIISEFNRLFNNDFYFITYVVNDNEVVTECYENYESYIELENIFAVGNCENLLNELTLLKIRMDKNKIEKKTEKIDDNHHINNIKKYVERFKDESEFLNTYKIDKDDYEYLLDMGEIKVIDTFYTDKDILKSLKSLIKNDEIISEFLNPYYVLTEDELLKRYIEKNKHFHTFTIGNEVLYSDCCEEISGN